MRTLSAVGFTAAHVSSIVQVAVTISCVLWVIYKPACLAVLRGMLSKHCNAIQSDCLRLYCSLAMACSFAKCYFVEAQLQVCRLVMTLM